MSITATATESSGPYGNFPEPSDWRNGRDAEVRPCASCDEPHDLERTPDGRFHCHLTGYSEAA